MQRKTKPNLLWIFALAVLLIVTAGFGCSSWERQTFQLLAADKGLIDQAFDDYNSGKISNTPAIHDLLNTAKSKHNDVTQLFLSYVQAEQQAKSQCAQGCKDALAKQQALVVAALQELVPIIASIQGLISSEKKTTAQEFPYIRPLPWQDPRRILLI